MRHYYHIPYAINPLTHWLRASIFLLLIGQWVSRGNSASRAGHLALALGSELVQACSVCPSRVLLTFMHSFWPKITGVQKYRILPKTLTPNWLCPFARMAMVKCNINGAGESALPSVAPCEVRQHREAGKDQKQDFNLSHHYSFFHLLMWYLWSRNQALGARFGWRC